MAEFRKASTDFKSAFEEEMRDLERQARIAELKKQAAEANAATKAILNEAVNPQVPPPVTQASPAGTDGTTNPDDAHLTEAPVITPNTEAVARLDGATVESTAAAESTAAESSSPHDQQHA